ncbi:hypothetical protein [Bacteroides thetaiotaomicron]|jgi:hypothetical protein|uniref:hypothetical protein n=1 Tax=Bacteroides thetaiotaomicron TaxID=818 RepID=UPI0018AB2352|nr:hypothetical protein [Bacteroides thetaiotaomicron]MDC2248142.1 hypothetical protein [Bacteroides thetaiotaomicron]MDC2253255.1 hypothetical protein [Bacteroides thetaiotaomicron]MDC2267233.1 hypothetical protein [Bacteroides thetaiotaomicron]
MNNIFLTTKQTKAIKVLIDNLDSDNEAIQRMRYGLRTTDTGDMTLEEAQSIIDRMKPEKKNAVNKMLLESIQVSPNTYYNMEKNANEIYKSWWFILIMWVFIIGMIALGIMLVSILSVSIYGYFYGLLKFMLLI